MAYKDTEKRLNELRSRDEIMFRMAISHLMDVGIRNLTPQLIEECCEEINQQDDSHSFMTNQYQCELVRLAGEIARLDHIEVLVYIQQNVEYAVYSDGVNVMIPYRRMKEIAKMAMEELCSLPDSYRRCYAYADDWELLQDALGMTPDELEAFGYLSDEEDEDNAD